MSSPTVNIRLAERSDLPEVHALVGELAIYERAEAEFVATHEDYFRAFEEGIFEVLLAEVDGQTAGIALYYMTFSTWKGKMLYLEDFVVKTDHRRLGLGQQLFDAFLDRARSLGCKMVKWQVLDWNEPAINFYRKNGAIIEREWWNGKIFL